MTRTAIASPAMPVAPLASSRPQSPSADPLDEFRRVVRAGILPTLEQSAAVMEALDALSLNLATARIRVQLQASLVDALKAANEELRGLVDSLLTESWETTRGYSNERES